MPYSSLKPAPQRVTAALIAGCLAILAGSVCGIGKSQAQEFDPSSNTGVANQERIAPWTLAKFPPQANMNEVYWPRTSSDTPAFFRDSLLQLVARTYYLTRDNFDGSKSQGWAGGGWVAWRSGLIGNLFGVHIAGYTSQPLFAPADEGGTRLFAPPNHSIGVLGQIYGRVQIADQEVRGGRQLIDTPLINPHDNRMVPNTFESVSLVSLPDNDRLYDYAVGYIWNMKQRDSNDFIAMSDALAGADVTNHGAAYGILKARPIPGLSLVAMDYNVQDFINTGFGQAEYDFRLPKGVPNWIIGANVIGQQGTSLLAGTQFDTYQASAKAEMNYAGWTLFVAGSATGRGSSIFSPYGAKPTYTDMQQLSFDLANEKAFGGGAIFDFGSVGLPGLSAGAWYTRAWDAINTATNLRIPDEKELNLWLQYRPSEGPLKGFRFKTQYSDVWQQGNVRSVQPELRVIVDYTVLFRPPPPVVTTNLVTK
jgi:hypothetical protein